MSDFLYQKGLANYLLTPVSGIYRQIIALRRLLYKTKIFKITHFKTPVIVVGNITVGGTGKTPFVIWLANWLKQQGHNPGIVSRGYQGKSSYYPRKVEVNSDWREVGDEPILLARNTNCPVIVDPDRVRAVEFLLQNYKCSIVISDDGLQHYALGRALEIILLDGSRLLGNGFCLPAGCLREPKSKLKNADFILTQHPFATTSFKDFFLRPKCFRNVKDPTLIKSLEDFKNQHLTAIAGIGNPKNFFRSLKNLGIDFSAHPYPDHHAFQAEDIIFKNNSLIMTEKDAVKCQSFVKENCWYLDVEAVISENVMMCLQQRLETLTSIDR